MAGKVGVHVISLSLREGGTNFFPTGQCKGILVIVKLHISGRMLSSEGLQGKAWYRQAQESALVFLDPECIGEGEVKSPKEQCPESPNKVQTLGRFEVFGVSVDHERIKGFPFTNRVLPVTT